MRRNSFPLVLVSAAALFVAACRDSSRAPSVTAPVTRVRSTSGNTEAPPPGTCTTLEVLLSEAATLFGSGSPDYNSVRGKLENLDHLIDIGEYATARAHAFTIVDFVLLKWKEGGLPGSAADAVQLVNHIFCFAGLGITITDPYNASAVFPTDSGQTLVNSTNSAGTQLPANAVSEPTIIEINVIPDTFPLGQGPLDTRLDQYPGFISITKSSETGAGLTQPVVVAVCMNLPIPASVFARLRLGHQKDTGFELAPPADPSFLNCSTSSSAQSGVPRWLRRVASLVLPKTLYASLQEEEFRSGGVGGTAGEYSEFDAVDPELRSSGGVGGTAGEYQRRPAVPRTLNPEAASSRVRRGAAVRAPAALANVVSGCDSAVVTTELDPACRPGFAVRTRLGTVLQDVPVSWNVTAGGGVVAPEASGSRSCGTFGSTAETATDSSGKAGVCWTMGSTPGTNSVVATPRAGGDAPPGVTFSPPDTTFTVTAIRITPTATATGGTFEYDGLPHPGSGTCSHGLTPELSYSGDGSVPVNAGTYTLTVTCGAGNPMFYTVTATATITITKAPSVTTVSCPASVVYNGSAQTPCSAVATGAGGLNVTLPVSYANNTDAGTATASAIFGGDANHTGSGDSRTFEIDKAPTVTTVTCPDSVLYTGSPYTPCTAAVTGPGGLSQPVTPVTYVNNIVGTATATATYSGGVNWLSSTGTDTFRILYVQVDCFSSPIYNVMPDTKSAQRKGSNLPVKCSLKTATGAGVVNAHGDLLVEDKGTNPTGPASPTIAIAFSGTDLFKVSGPGNYSYGLDTSPAGFISGHFYYVTATWTDGSKTRGWFYIR